MSRLLKSKIIFQSALCLLITVMSAGCFSSSINSKRSASYRPNVNGRNVSQWARDPKVGNNPNVIIGARPLQHGDKVWISLLGIPDSIVNLEDVVDEKGNIKIRYLGNVKVGGLTTSAAEKLIETTYIKEEYYRKVTVSIVKKLEGEYYVKGEVKGIRGKYELAGTITLLKALAEAGGVTPFADSKRILIIRDGVISRHNAVKIEQGKVIDPQILPDDIISVPKRGPFRL